MLIRLNTWLLICLAPLAGITQNLVLNPSFSEVHNQERDFIGNGIDNTLHWKCVNTADYVHKREIKGHKQLARMYLNEPKEYLIGSLTVPLEKDTEYVMSLAVYGLPGVEKWLGLVFMDSIPAMIKTEHAHYSEVDVFAKSGNTLHFAPSKKRAVAWRRVSLTFKATSPARFFLLGNFFAFRDRMAYVDDFDLRKVSEAGKRPGTPAENRTLIRSAE